MAPAFPVTPFYVRPMRVLEIDDASPLRSLSFRCAASEASGVGSLAICQAFVDGLPHAVEALIVTSDLQGVVQEGDRTESLGEMTARSIRLLQSAGQLPGAATCGCILAGDLHAGAGEENVHHVWLAMGSVSRWVAGVAGNHDLITTDELAGESTAQFSDNCYLLDGSAVTLDGLRVGGLGGIVGACGGHRVRTEQAYCTALARLLQQRCDLVILHDGPNAPERNLPGWPSIRQVLEAASPTLVIRGHDHWSTPLATLSNGTQVLNVEGRVIVLRKSRGGE
jgi:hypothetical protein